MHMSDALVSPPVAAAAAAVAVSLIAVAVVRLKRNGRPDSLALTGVMGAFIFVAQMLNFAIPGTGSSGHIVGGILLAAMLGPWAAFLTLASVLIIQCLVFADGGLMALGCNLINMGAMSTLVAYPLVFRPIAGRGSSAGRIAVASIVASIVGLELGALLVSVETELSGVTALPMRDFLLLMLPIHLAVGAVEGVATAAVLTFVFRVRRELLYGVRTAATVDSPAASVPPRRQSRLVITVIACLVVALGMCAAGIASSNPDGLEWSIKRLTGDIELPADADPNADAPSRRAAETIRSHTSVMPDYENRFSGLAGALLVVFVAGGVAYWIKRQKT